MADAIVGMQPTTDSAGASYADNNQTSLCPTDMPDAVALRGFGGYAF